MSANSGDLDWMAVIGRALSFLCLHDADLTDKSLLEQADFLSRLGIPRKEAAALLGTTDDSLRVMQGRAKAGVKKTAKANG